LANGITTYLAILYRYAKYSISLCRRSQVGGHILVCFIFIPTYRENDI
jgi:hypothetical protein